MLFTQKVTLFKGHFSLVVLEGFEPSQAEPESDVLPLHHRTIPNCDCKGTAFFVTTKKNPNFFSKYFSLGKIGTVLLLPSTTIYRDMISLNVTGVISWDVFF